MRWDGARARQAGARRCGAKANALISSGLAERFYIAAPRGLVAPSEVPLGWGLLEIHGRNNCYVTIQAPQHRLADGARVWRKWTTRCASRCSHQVREQARAIERLTVELRELNDKVLRVAM